MKFYSEILDELFDTQAELEQKEEEQKNKDNAREAAYNAVIDAAEKRDEAQAEFETLRDEYVKKYGAIALNSKNGKYSNYREPNPFSLLFGL